MPGRPLACGLHARATCRSPALDDTDPLRHYTARVLVTVAIGALALLLWKLSGLLLLVFGAVVLAVALRALMAGVTRWTPLSDGVALTLVALALAAGFSLLMWLFGSQLAVEIEGLRQGLPAAWSLFQDWLEQSPIGPAVRDVLDEAQGSASAMAARAGALAMSATGSLANLLLVVVGGIYLAAQPALYRSGVLKLFPAGSRATLGEALDASGHALKLWLGGQLLAMAVVGVLTGIGLWLLGVPVALGLAVITALLNFVPIIGPIAAAVPAVLLAFTVSPQIGLATLALYLVVQQVESNVLQPLIQQRAVDLPPALLLFSLFGVGALFGITGLLLAAPLTVVLYVLVKCLYVREVLETEAQVPTPDAD